MRQRQREHSEANENAALPRSELHATERPGH